MARPRFSPVTPPRRDRDLAKELRELEREEPGPERARRLASFARETHERRQLNLAMIAARLCLEDDPDDPALLVAAYVVDGAVDEERLRALGDLRDLARYVGRGDIGQIATDRLAGDARAWVTDVEEADRRHRLRTLASILPREQVDDLRDELDASS